MAQINPFRPINIDTNRAPITDEGRRAADAVLAWLKKPSTPIFRLFGPAGTGKTTLAKDIAARVGGAVSFAAFSGKAASVMRQKGCPNAATIHNLIYVPSSRNGKVTFTLNEESRLRSASLVIVDEASMVDERLGRDLEAFGRPILVLGDIAQLPPVKGRGYFTREKPDFALTSIHRQRRNSPIIRLATRVREGKQLPEEAFGESFVRRKIEVDVDTFLNADQILVGTNDSKHRFNCRLRELRGLPSGQPCIHDKLVCLKNNASKGIFNGEIWFVQEVLETTPDLFRMTLRSETGERSGVTVNVRREFFSLLDPKLSDKNLKNTDQFSFAYALTVHKAQGSEWPSVILFDESKLFSGDEAKWLYTGITRASESIKIYV